MLKRVNQYLLSLQEKASRLGEQNMFEKSCATSAIFGNRTHGLSLPDDALPSCFNVNNTHSSRGLLTNLEDDNGLLDSNRETSCGGPLSDRHRMASFCVGHLWIGIRIDWNHTSILSPSTITKNL